MSSAAPAGGPTGPTGTNAGTTTTTSTGGTGTIKPKVEETTVGGLFTSFVPSAGFMAVLGGLAILPFIFMIIFHAGAAYLSYQKYQSGFYAFINFFFAYFYYPYYAFFLAGSSPGYEASPVNSMLGGLRKMFSNKRKSRR